MKTARRSIRALVTLAALVAPGVWAAPVGVSPGSADRFAAVLDVCPTFSWAGAGRSDSLELVVYRLAETAEGPETVPVVRATLPGEATSWTPDADRCLEPAGRYAWSVREVGADADLEAAGSAALLFEIRSLPAEAEYLRALAVVQRYLDHRGEAPEAVAGGPTAPPSSAGRPTREKGVAAAGTGVTAISGRVADTTGLTRGVHGIAHSPDGFGVVAENADAAGADLQLAGAEPAALSETGLSRASSADLTFDVANPGGGTMTLQADGIDVVTTATDQDTLAELTCGSGEIAQWTDSQWQCAPVLGDVSSVTAGPGLAGGGVSGDLVLQVAGQGITNAMLAADAVSGDEIAPDTITAADLAAGSVAAAEVVASEVQLRVSGVCAPGQSMSGIHVDGSVACTPFLLPPPLVTTVDPGNAGTHASIAIGTDGFPVIAYRVVPDGLTVAKCNDPACSGGDETISLVDPGNTGHHASIAIGTDGFPVISYLTGGSGLTGLTVAKCNDPACAGNDETITLLDAGNTGLHTSLAIGADGFPVISYRDQDADALQVAKCNDAACTGGDETITIVDDDAIATGFFTSIAIGGDAFPVISYFVSFATSALKVAKCNDPACAGEDETLTAVDSAGSVGSFSSIALGADDLPVISYQDLTNGALKVAKCNDPACAGLDETITTVDAPAGAEVQYTSLALGADGFPVIAYHDHTAGTLRMVRCNDPACAGGDEWATTVDSSAHVGEYASLALDSLGLAVIAYHDATAGTLEVAKCRTVTCQ